MGPGCRPRHRARASFGDRRGALPAPHAQARRRGRDGGAGDGMTIRLLTYSLSVQADVVGARQRARQVAELLGFDGREQTRIATSVSEIARNAFRYAGGGKVEFEIEGETAPQLLVIRVLDDGPGIERLEEVLDGTYRSSTGMGIGLIGSRRLMDRWEVHSTPGKG